MELQLRVSGHHHEVLKNHLLPADGKEAVAVALCGRLSDSEHEILLVHDVILIPHNECYIREADLIHWSTERIQHYFKKVGDMDFGLMKIHSHPGGYEEFSKKDDFSDKEFFDSVFGWSRSGKPHASSVMLPGGRIFGRFFFNDLNHRPIDKIMVAGDTIQQFVNGKSFRNSDFALRTIQAFGEHTYQSLSGMTIGIVGCSGTGSPVVEQLVRLGIGRLVLVDPDNVERKNLNRILNTTDKDAEENRPKEVVLADAINNTGLGTIVDIRQTNIFDSVETLKILANCNAVFGCMDSVDGRHLLNQLSTFYLLPYFDLGVKLEADGFGGISKICGSVHYLQPGMSSLITRGVYTMEDLRASSQFRKNPEEYEDLKKEAYIKNVNINNPAVISVNMQIASHAVNEFLNRIHPFKSEPPSSYAASTIDITEGYIVNSAEKDFEEDSYLKKKQGRGDMLPFIEMPELIL